MRLLLVIFCLVAVTVATVGQNKNPIFKRQKLKDGEKEKADITDQFNYMLTLPDSPRK